MWWPGLGTGQFQNPLGDDPELDLAGAAFDRIGLAAQPFARGLACLRPPGSPIRARPEPPAAMTSSCRALLSSVPAYFIIEGWAGCAMPAFSSSMNRSDMARKAMASTSKRAMSARSRGSSRRPLSSRADHLHQSLAEAAALAAEAHAADHLALVAEQIFGDVPTLVDLADQLGPSAPSRRRRRSRRKARSRR